MDTDTSEQERHIRHQTVDPAALAGAAIAAALAVFSEPGPFMPMNLVVGITLVTILLTYELKRYRTGWQHLAYGAVCALCSLMIVGFVFEFLRGGRNLHYWRGVDDSRMTEWELLIWWLGLTCIFTFWAYKKAIPIPEQSQPDKQASGSLEGGL